MTRGPVPLAATNARPAPAAEAKGTPIPRVAAGCRKPFGNDRERRPRVTSTFGKCGSKPHIAQVDLVFIALLILGGGLGFAMGWGALARKWGCAFLCVTPFLIFAVSLLEPLVTGERQSSTASLALFFGPLWIGVAAAAGSMAGALAHRLVRGPR